LGLAFALRLLPLQWLSHCRTNAYIGTAGPAFLHYLICLAYFSLFIRNPVIFGPGCLSGYYSYIPVLNPLFRRKSLHCF